MGGCFVAAVVASVCCVTAMVAMPASTEEAQQHAERGAACAQSGDLVCAEAELRKAIALAPDDASYLTSLGGVLGMQQKLQLANVYFEKAVKVDPNNTAARRNLAANEWRLGQLTLAQENLEHLLRAEPRDQSATLLLGMVFENEHEYARAAKLLSAVPNLVRQRPESVAALASAYYHTGHRAEAHSLLEGLQGKPSNPQGIFIAAGVAAQADDYAIAESLFESIRSTYPNTTALDYNLALIRFRTGRVAESRKILLDLIAAGRGNGETYQLLSKCYEKENNLGEAVSGIENAIRLQPDAESNYHDLVALLMSNNRLAAALKTAERTVRAFPKSASARLTLAGLQMRADEFTDALTSYTRALEIDPKSLDAQVGMAGAKWGAGMRSAAEAEYQMLVKQHPRDASIFQNYGTSLLAGAADDAMLDRAAGLLKRAIELKGSSAESHYELGMAYLKKSGAGAASDSLRQAQEQLETASRLGLNDSRVHYALARVYRRVGRESDAAREMHSFEQIKAVEQSGPSGELVGQARPE